MKRMKEGGGSCEKKGKRGRKIKRKKGKCLYHGCREIPTFHHNIGKNNMNIHIISRKNKKATRPDYHIDEVNRPPLLRVRVRPRRRRLPGRPGVAHGRGGMVVGVGGGVTALAGGGGEVDVLGAPEEVATVVPRQVVDHSELNQSEEHEGGARAHPDVQRLHVRHWRRRERGRLQGRPLASHFLVFYWSYYL